MQQLRRFRKAPEPAPPPPPPSGPFDSLVVALGLPVTIARQFWLDFLKLRPWWPILIPIMIWVARRTYQRERALFLEERALPPSQEE